MKASKVVKSFVQHSSETRLAQLQKEIHKELQRRAITTIYPDRGPSFKIGTVVRGMYNTFLVAKTKLVKDKRGAVYKEVGHTRMVRTKSGYKFTKYYRLNHNGGAITSFILDYANKKRIKLNKQK